MDPYTPGLYQKKVFDSLVTKIDGQLFTRSNLLQRNKKKNSNLKGGAFKTDICLLLVRFQD